MNRVAIKAAIRVKEPERLGLGMNKGGNVKFFIDKADRILYAPRFIYDSPTLRG
ncbi:MAG: hypothetical protein MUQ25_06340 [Candidatus Aminicenantes bacterium]|nr:hypothetical protein [Candidatus Aminicenantes bacterium]